MTIAYIANIRLPTEKAHGYQIMRVCSALAARGHSVVLYVPGRHNHIAEDPFAYYGVEKNFSVAYIPAFDWIRFASLLGPAAFFLQSFLFLRALTLRIKKDTIVYTRNAEAVWYLSRRGFSCFYNAHNWSNSRLTRFFLRNARGVICNSSGTKHAISNATNLASVVVHNASDPNPYVGSDKGALRRELNLPADAFVALYSGHLFGWKGSGTLVSCAKLLEDVGRIHFVCIGGTAEDIAYAKARAGKNMHVLGHQKKVLVPKFLAAADLLLLPNTKESEESVRFTSPLKLFEYMASGVPILASDLPSMREVLSESTALFAEAGNPMSFATRIREVVQNNEVALSHAKEALKSSQSRTWEAHAEEVETFLESHI